MVGCENTGLQQPAGIIGVRGIGCENHNQENQQSGHGIAPHFCRLNGNHPSTEVQFAKDYGLNSFRPMGSAAAMATPEAPNARAKPPNSSRRPNISGARKWMARLAISRIPSAPERLARSTDSARITMDKG